MADTKICQTCGIGKPLSDFYQARESTSDRMKPFPDCKWCTQQMRASGYRDAKDSQAAGGYSLKVCRSCRIEKPVGEFYLTGATYSGKPIYKADCRDCCTKARADRDISNPEFRTSRLARKRISHAKNADAEREYRIRNRHRQPTYTKNYDRKYPGRISMVQAKSKKKNRAKVRITEVLYRAKNPDANRLKVNRRRSRKMNAPGSHTAEALVEIRLLQKDRCACCRKKLLGRGHLDHRLALSKDGSNDRRNLQFLCGSCNSSKLARDEIEFMQSRGKLI